MKNYIRNFCIIAHIDHGKSTLADRFLEYTKTVPKRQMRDQLLDQMDLERERGITIKLQPVSMAYEFKGNLYTLNLIDTPGHVDFTYEVSRSLAAVEGALLLVDATQGIQAQTLANLYLTLEQNLVILPVINKIDLAGAQIAKTKKELKKLLGISGEEILLASGKTGQGVQGILEEVIKKVPAPILKPQAPLRALIFDSRYDSYKGVITYVRLVDGEVKKDDKIKMMKTGAVAEVLEVGVFKPELFAQDHLLSGEIGYIITSLKEVNKCRVGDTITFASREIVVTPLAGYKEIKSMVFAGIFPKEGSDFKRLREAMEKLKLSDASLFFEPENSLALGFGFRAGFLGLLHLEIVEERLKREYNLDLIITTPSVAYKIYQRDGQEFIIKSPLELPDPSKIERIEEPIMKLDIITPRNYLGAIMQLVEEGRGDYKNMEYLSGVEGNQEEERVILHYEIPLVSILVDFYDKLKSASSGYASLNYDFLGYRAAAVVKLDFLIAQEPVEALATIVYRDNAYQVAKKIVKKLKEVLPRELFEVKLQAAIGGKIIASEKIPPLRKDVTAKLYGGDVTRKRKLLEKQKKGKKRLKSLGKVDLPPEAFLAVLKR